MRDLEASTATLDATAQADLVRRGEVSPVELVEAAIRRIEKHNPLLNAVILTRFERALEQARTHLRHSMGNAAFRGVPILLKDLGAALAGEPLYSGMGALRRADWREPEESVFASRLLAAGFCVLGRTNTPELGLMPTTEPEAFGATRNPWSLDHSPGGSSGGAAAAVASGMVPVAHASDGGGSIRIPASSCGLVGLKPTRGRTSFGPGTGERWAGFSAEHVVARTVRDAAALLDVLHGPAPGDPYFAAPPPAPFVDRLEPGPRLRIGVMAATGPRGVAVHPECSAAALRTARALTELGHHVEPSYPPALDEEHSVEWFVSIVASNVAFALDAVGTKLGRALIADDVEPLTWALAAEGRKRSASNYLVTLDAIHSFSRRIASWWVSGWDLLLTPTTGAPPPRIGELVSSPADPFRGFMRAAPYALFTPFFNMTGQPAISLPVYWTSEGLPIGVQLVAPYGGEDVLLRVAAELEQALPWHDRHPALFSEC